MATSDLRKKTILARGTGGAQVEEKAVGSFLPGVLLKRTADGFEPFDGSTHVGAPQTLFALNLSMAGQAIETAYEDGDDVVALHFLPGDGVNALIDCVGAVVKGDVLVAAADGRLAPALDGTNADDFYAVAVALEDRPAGFSGRIMAEVMTPAGAGASVVSYAITPATQSVKQGETGNVALRRTVNGVTNTVSAGDKWAVTGAGVTIDADGVVTVGAGAATGARTVSVTGIAGVTATVTITTA